MSAPRPPMIRTDSSNAFAHNTMKVRVPAIIQEVQRLNPDYSAEIQQALDQLRADLENDAPIPMISLPSPDYEDWLALYKAHAGQTWLNAEWFYAEVFFYRHLMQAMRWFETGRDPFTPKKAEEIAGESLWNTLKIALSVEHDLPLTDRLSAALLQDLWGNRIDLSYAVSAAHGGIWHDDDLLADDRQQAIHRLRSIPPGIVHIIADNAGTELALDLVLIDVLLSGIAKQVILHLKMHPTFVSDAMVSDVLAFLDTLAEPERGDAANQLAIRLRAHLIAGRLRLAPDFYWNNSRLLWDLPPRLVQTFTGAALVILKGDANYRRAVSDALWAPETTFGEVTAYFPAPLLALRTLKSDAIVGLPVGLAGQLDTSDPAWRVNGRRGVIQGNFG